MTVSIPLAGFNRSGGVKTLLLLANAMTDRGWHVRIVVPAYASEPTFDLRPGVEVSVLRTPTSGWLRLPAYYLALAWQAARDTDVCIANFYLTAYCAVLSAVRFRRARLVYFVQGDEAESHGRLAGTNAVSRALRRALARASYRLPLRVVCISSWLRDRVGRPDGIVVSQGLDLTVFTASPRVASRQVVVGTIGGHAVAKGYPDVCAAIARLAPEIRASIGVLVVADADVPLPAGVRAERVTAHTESSMAAFYRRCDVFVFASRSEGFGLPPLEAMACGCAVVTTDCGGARDYVADGVNAVAVPVADVSALAAAVERLVIDGDRRAALVAHGIETASRRTRAQMLTELVNAVAA